MPAFKGKALKRRTAMFREVAELLPHLPTEDGEAFHGILTGRADLTVFLVAMIGHYAAQHCTLRLATLAFHSRNLPELACLLDAGKVDRITLLVSLFFKVQTPDAFQEGREYANRYPERWKLSACRNHAKLACLDLGSCKVTVESSANLRCNGNTEQVSVTMDAGLHDFYAAWIDETVAKHERDETQAATG